MRSARNALSILGLASLFTLAVSASSAVTAKETSTYKLPHNWEMYIVGKPAERCALMKVPNPRWGMTLAKISDKWVFQITDMRWLFPGPTKVEFEIQFGTEIPWTQKGQAVNPKTLQTSVGKEFIYRWKHYNDIKVKINGGMTYKMKLLGSRVNTESLEQCALSIGSSVECGPDCS